MITSPPRLLPMASHGCSCCGPASRADTASTPATSDSSAGGSSPSYQVTGLTCGHCAKSVTQALQAHYVVSSSISGRRRFIACPPDWAGYVYFRSLRLKGQWN